MSSLILLLYLFSIEGSITKSIKKIINVHLIVAALVIDKFHNKKQYHKFRAFSDTSLRIPRIFASGNKSIQIKAFYSFKSTRGLKSIKT